jgi:hypothetical protein
MELIYFFPLVTFKKPAPTPFAVLKILKEKVCQWTNEFQMWPVFWIRQIPDLSNQPYLLLSMRFFDAGMVELKDTGIVPFLATGFTCLSYQPAFLYKP